MEGDHEDQDPVAARRRVVDLAVTRRPDITLDELHHVLGRLGIDVAPDVLLADLDALGFEVDEESEVVEEDQDQVAGADGTDAEGAPGDEGRPGRGRLVPVLWGVAALLALAAVVVAVVGLLRDDDGGGGDGEATRSTATSPEVITFETTPDGEVVLGDLAPDVSLTFDDDGPLPDPGGEAEWSPGRGIWLASEGVARSGPPGEDESVTFFAAPGPDLDARVTLPTASPGAGLAFRLLDDGNYLAWVLGPEGSGARLVRVTDAQQTVVEEVDATVGSPVVLGVRARGAELELLVDGEVVATVEDDGPTDRVGVGLAALGTDEPPALDDLQVTYG
ncbi:hypothetical protein PO878_18365 [Iamia majanohamensis]|uniref:Uncharacterized protein n=1 Tax=Iamia majanohamensis TaxID=467976 RepID=A0AAE9Y6G8_9ACTN|nr:hypothetical protein [Iamia majanohamensis]WCO66466.1 hypothetical protein PO878_18365 [Iamia majanohamensis]